MAIQVASTSAKNVAQFVTNINALIGPLLSNTIQSIQFNPGVTLSKLGDDLQFSITYATTGSVITNPYFVNAFTGNTLTSAIASAQAFITANPTYFISPIYCLISNPGSSRTASNIVFLIYNASSADGAANWAGGGSSSGGISGTLVAGRIPFASGASALTDNVAMTFSNASGFSVNRTGRAGTETFGLNAGNTSIGGINNTLIGNGAGNAINAAANNVIIGTSAAATLSNGSGQHVVIGSGAGSAITTGSGFVILGYQAGANVQTGGGGYVFVGNQAGQRILNGGNNTGIGALALRGSATVSSNTGNDCTAVGTSALTAVTSAANATAIGSNAGTALLSGANNTLIGYNAGASTTTGASNTLLGASSANRMFNGGQNIAIGASALIGSAVVANNTGGQNVVIGSFAASLVTSASTNVIIGDSAAGALLSGSNNIILGGSAGANVTTGSNNILIGAASQLDTAGLSNRMIVGSDANFISDAYFGSGSASDTPQSITFHATAPNLANSAGASFTLAGGQGTGTGVGGSLIFRTAPAGGAGGSQNALVTALTIDSTQLATFGGNISITDAKNIVLGTTTGTKIGTAANQKLALFNASPVVQPATTGTAAGFTAGAGTAVQDVSTFTGGTGSTAYRISDVVLALKQLGILAA